MKTDGAHGVFCAVFFTCVKLDIIHTVAQGIRSGRVLGFPCPAARGGGGGGEEGGGKLKFTRGGKVVIQ